MHNTGIADILQVQFQMTSIKSVVIFLSNKASCNLFAGGESGLPFVKKLQHLWSSIKQGTLKQGIPVVSPWLLLWGLNGDDVTHLVQCLAYRKQPENPVCTHDNQWEWFQPSQQKLFKRHSTWLLFSSTTCCIFFNEYIFSSVYTHHRKPKTPKENNLSQQPSSSPEQNPVNTRLKSYQRIPGSDCLREADHRF